MLRFATAASSTGNGREEPYSASRNRIVSLQRADQSRNVSVASCATSGHSVAYQLRHDPMLAGDLSKCHTGETQCFEKFGTYHAITKRTVLRSPAASATCAACSEWSRSRRIPPLA